MRRIRNLVSVMGLALAVLAGCTSLETNQNRPPKAPEEFREPPQSDARYSRVIEYPKDTMEQDALQKKARDASKNLPGPMRGGVAGQGGRAF